MTSHLWFYQLLLAALVLVCLLIHVWWPDPLGPASPKSLKPDKPRRKRSKEPKPFTRYVHKPLCEACKQGLDSRPKAPGAPPPVIIFTRGRRRTVDTAQHFCPDHNCYFLHDLRLNQIQLDELYVVLRAVRDGDVSEDEAIEQLSQSH